VTDEQKDGYLTPERRVTFVWLIIVGLAVTFFIWLGSGIDADERIYLDILRNQEKPSGAAWVESRTDGQLLRLGKDACHHISAGEIGVNSPVKDVALAYFVSGCDRGLAGRPGLMSSVYQCARHEGNEIDQVSPTRHDWGVEPGRVTPPLKGSVVTVLRCSRYWGRAVIIDPDPSARGV
jgi:hypothetical protein